MSNDDDHPDDPKENTSGQQKTGTGNEHAESQDLLSDDHLFGELRDLDTDELKTAKEDIEKRYVAKIKEFRDLANSSVDNYHDNRESHIRWRKRIVILTGALAIVNLMIAFTAGLGELDWFPGVDFIVKQGIPLGAAVFAAVIAILSNLENLYKFPDRAQGFRDAREILLDAAVNLETDWFTAVKPFGDTPEAVQRAILLLKRAAKRDSEVRAKVKELTARPREQEAGH